MIMRSCFEYWMSTSHSDTKGLMQGAGIGITARCATYAGTSR